MKIQLCIKDINYIKIESHYFKLIIFRKIRFFPVFLIKLMQA